MSKENGIDIRTELRVHIVRKYGTQTLAAKAWGVSSTYVSQVLNGKRAMPDHMAKEAGFELVKAAPYWVRIKKGAA